MSDKFRNKYRIPSARLQHWDYSSNAMYFVTICTQNREYYFGKINNGDMVLSQIGIIAQQYWMEIPIHFPFVVLDAFVVMPNHVHGIIIIDKHVQTQNIVFIQNNVETQIIASLPQNNKFGPQSNNLASIVRGFKIGVTKYARINKIEFNWQPRYYDNIIRNNDSYKRVVNYIINNPIKWSNDKFFQDIT